MLSAKIYRKTVKNICFRLSEGIMDFFRGNFTSHFSDSPFLFLFIFLRYNRNPHGQSVPFHPPRNLSCSFRLPQSDRLLRSCGESLVLRPDKGKFPVNDTDSALFPKAYISFYFCLVIYVPYAALLPFL